MNQSLIVEKDRYSIRQKNSFDIIRYYFSFVVLFTHYAELSGNKFTWINNSGEAVGGFFILSGFLVFNSFTNKPDLKDYLLKRAKRIFPAYCFIVLFCFIVGIFLTNLPIFSYFDSTQSIKYLLSNLSFMNFIEPCLPGVFTQNIMCAVNGSLWTMKVEVLLYLSVPIAYYLLKRYNKLIVLISIYLFSIVYILFFEYLYEKTSNEFYLILKRQVGGQFIYFYSGTFLLLYFKQFQKYIVYIFPIALIIYLFRYQTNLDYIQPICFAILIIGIAYHTKFLSFLGKYNNVAYGIYLFHFPIIQIVVNYRLNEYNYLLGLFTTIAGTIALSIFSWYIIEKPILRHKKIALK